MVLQDYKIDGDYIRISKKELEECRDHYHKLAQHHKGIVVTLSGYPYVHELQHALRLAGMKEMADNLKI